MTAAPVTPDWRSSQLPQLTGLPLLPVGAGADGKAPIDTNTELPMAGWKTASWAPDAIARADSNVVTAVGMRCGPDAGGLLCIDADGATALEALLAAGCDPDAAGWRISRPTAPDRLKVVFRVPEAQWPAPGSRRAGKVVIPTGPGEQLELFWGKGQVVVAGLHRPSGALLDWVGGPASITELPPAWLALWESAEPAAPAPAPPAAEIHHRPDAIALEALLPRDLEQLARNGAGEGERNAAMFKLAAAALAIQPAALSAGLLVDGTAESLVVAAAMRCSPPLAESEVLTILRSAESQPRTLDPGWPDRLRYHLNRRSKTSRKTKASRKQQPDPARPVEQQQQSQDGRKEAQAIDTDSDSFQDIIQELPSGWVITEQGPRATRIDVGQLAGMIEQKKGSVLRFNEMTMYVEAKTSHGWQPVKDAEMDSAYVLLHQKGWLVNLESVIKALCHVARQRSIHPVREYLLGIEKDSSITPYDLDKVGPDMFRAVNPLHAAMVRKWLIGAAARVLRPGCQMDYCLVLHSRQQGMLKSSALTELASEEWHTSSIPKDDKDFLLNVHSTWLYELAELESYTNKRAAGELKNTITTRTDNFRVPYGRTNERRKRPSVFCGSVNTDSFLRDETGSRRYWVVPIEGSEKLNIDAIKKHRDDIWKAAVLAYRTGELPMLTEEQEALSERQNDGFQAQDAWLEMLQSWMAGRPLARFRPEDPLPSAYQESDFYTAAEILYSAGLKRPDQINNHDSTRLGPLLRDLGFSSKRVTVGKSKVRRWTTDRQGTTRTTQDHPETDSGGPASSVAPQPISAEGPPGPPEKDNNARRSGDGGQLAQGNEEKELFETSGGPSVSTAESASVCSRSERTTCPTDLGGPSGGPEPVSRSTGTHASDPWAPAWTSRPPNWPTWGDLLLQLRAENPAALPVMLANTLMAHGHRAEPRRVADLLQAWDAHQEVA